MAENVTISLNVSTEKAVNSLKDFKGQMRELKGLQIQYVEAVEAGDVKLQASLKKQMSAMVQLKNDMMDTQKAMQYLDPGELLGGWIKMTQGVVGSFAAISGAMSLFGNESEQIQEIEKKSMALIQTMMGLEQARQLLIDGGSRAQLKALFQTTAAQIKQAAATVVQTVAQKGATLATEGGTVATRALGIAMKSLPIMWLVAGVAAIGAAVYGLIKLFQKQKSVEEDLYESQKEVFDSAFEAAGKMKTLGDAILTTTKGTISNTKAIDDYNKAAKEQNLMLVNVNGSLEQQNRVMEFNEKLIINRSKLVAAQNELDKSNAEVIKIEMALDQARVDGNKKVISMLENMLVEQNKNSESLVNYQNKMISANATMEQRIKLQGSLTAKMDENTKKTDEAAEKQAAAVEKIKNAWISANDAADKYYYDLVKNSLKGMEKINFQYQEDLAKYKLYVDKKYWTQEQYDNAIRILNVKYVEDRKAELGEMEKMEIKSIEKIIEKEVELRQINLDNSEKSIADDIINWDESNKTKLQLLKYYYDKGEILTDDYLKYTSQIVKEQVDKYAEHINSIGSNISNIFSNLTEMAMIEIEKQDYAWQQSYENRNTSLTDSLENAKKVWGEESKQYKTLLQEQINLDNEKKTHDDNIEKEKKAAQNKYAKAQLSIQMAQATAEFGKGIAGIWATELGTKGALGTPFAIAMTALLSGVYATQMALMAKQMGAIGKMRKGGFIEGPSHEQGGVLRELEGGEAVINATSMRLPGVRNVVSTINELGGGTSFRDSSSSGILTVDSQSVANAVIEAIKVIPVAVSESEITQTQKRVQVIKNKTSF